MTFPNLWDYGRCPCSASFVSRNVQINITVRKSPVQLDPVPQGACHACGSRVYKAGVLLLLEALTRGEPARLTGTPWSSG